MDTLFNNPLLLQLFIKDVHGYTTSVIFTLQNFYPQQKDKTIMRNTNYKVIFHDCSDQTLMGNISKQIAPKRSTFIAECFKILQQNYPDEKYRYIVVDSHPKSALKDLELFIKANIMPQKDNVIRPIFFLL
jgi:hypothetical protein